MTQFGNFLFDFLFPSPQPLQEINISCDVIVVGGGPAGSSVSLILAKAGIRVLLVDDFKASFKIGESLPPIAKPVLYSVGGDQLWEYLETATKEKKHLPCYGNSSCWGSPNIHDIDFIMNPYGFGWHLDRKNFDNKLLELVKESPNAQVFLKTRFEDCTFDLESKFWTVQLRDQTTNLKQEVKCSWLIDASGRRHCIAKKFGESQNKLDHLIAFYALFPHISTELNEENNTLIEACEYGWWYTSPLPGSSRVVVFHTDDDLSVAKIVRTTEGFLSMLKNTIYIQKLLPSDFQELSPKVHCTSAHSGKLMHYGNSAFHWIAVGDAAMCFDPLSSQGMLTSISCSLKCANVVQRLIENPQLEESLEEYGQGLNSVFEKFLKNWKMYYGQETRWPEAPFWQRRQTGLM